MSHNCRRKETASDCKKWHPTSTLLPSTEWVPGCLYIAVNLCPFSFVALASYDCSGLHPTSPAKSQSCFLPVAGNHRQEVKRLVGWFFWRIKKAASDGSKMCYLHNDKSSHLWSLGDSKWQNNNCRYLVLIVNGEEVSCAVLERT